MAQRQYERALDFRSIAPALDQADTEDTLALAALMDLPVKAVLDFAKRKPGRLESTQMMLNAARHLDKGSRDKTLEHLIRVLEQASRKGDNEYDLALTALMSAGSQSPQRFRELVRKFGC